MKKTKGSLTLKIFFFIFLTDVTEAIAELFFKKGVNATGMENIALHNFFEFFLKLVSLPPLWLGVLFYLANFFLWIAVLSRVDLSVAFPVGSTTYILVPILAMIFLNEKVFFLRWVGICFIIAGICFVSKSTNMPEARRHES